MNYNKIKFKISAILLLTIAAVGFSSCSFTKNLHQAPQLDGAEVVRDIIVNQNDSLSPAYMAWDNYFTDTCLQTLLNESLEKNIDLQITLKRIQQAEANLSMANGAWQPTLSAVGQVSHSRFGTDGKTLNHTATKPLLGFAASWEIDLWGKLNNIAKAKYANLLQSQEYSNLVKTNLIAKVSTIYYALLALDKKLEITRQTVELLTKSTETLQSLMDAGQQNAAAVEQSRALLYNTQLSIPEIEKQIRIQENSLCVLLNRPLSGIERGNIDNQHFATKITEGIPAQWLSFRPDVKQAEYDLLAAYSLTDAARASFYPSLSLSSATFGLGADGFQHFFSLKSLAANIVGNLTQPIFNRNQLKGNLKIAQARQDEALLGFRQAALEAGKEVSDILYGFDVLQRKTEMRTLQLESLSKAASYTRELLLAGEATYTEVLNAQQNLLAAQISQIDDQYTQLTLNVGLYRALGGGK